MPVSRAESAPDGRRAVLAGFNDKSQGRGESMKMVVGEIKARDISEDDVIALQVDGKLVCLDHFNRSELVAADPSSAVIGINYAAAPDALEITCDRCGKHFFKTGVTL